MEARRTGLALSLVACASVWTLSSAHAQIMHRQREVAHSQNFIVFASSPEWAAKVSEAAELARRDLALYWLGEELPAWPRRCPIHVTDGPRLGAGGETRFSLLSRGSSPSFAGNWTMSIQGTRERILDSVLPHEITHTIFATHFAKYGKYVPRWADEGACTTVEHVSEKRKHEQHLQRYLRTGFGISFNRMFTMKDYPDPILPLYAQGHSMVQFLIDQGGPRRFIKFLEDGMRTERWEPVLEDHYAYETLGRFQQAWNRWLADGRPEDLSAYAPVIARDAEVLLASAQSGLQGDPQGGSQSDPQGGLRDGGSKANSGAMVALAGHSQPVKPSGAAASTDNINWYKRQFDQHQNTTLAPQRQQSTARPQQPQSTGIRVLDWGNSAPVSGIQSSSTGTTQGLRTSTIEMVRIKR